MRTEKAITYAYWVTLVIAAGCSREVAAPAIESNANDSATAEPAAAQVKSEETAETPSATEQPAPQPTGAEQTAVPERPSASEYLREVQMLVRSGNVDQAAEKLREAQEHYPNEEVLRRFHLPLYVAFRSSGREEPAQQQLDAYVSYLIASADQQSEDRFFEELAGISSVIERQESSEAALQLLDKIVEQAGKAAPPAEHALRAAAGQRAVQLAAANRADEARAIVDQQLAAATSALETEPQDRLRIAQLASALKYKAHLEQAVEGGDAQPAWKDYLDYLDKQAHAHPEDSIATRFLIEHIQRASMLSRTAPDEAEPLVERVASFIETNRDSANIHPMMDSQLQQLRQRIENSRRLLALIGSPAVYPENIDGWVNGGPLAPEDLKGKVVLLDFFSIWCGPCIATFPHLRQWHDDYADKGLQIVGISNYYQYGWNEEAKRGERVSGIEPPDERAAMEKFLAHYELRHPVGYVNDNALKEHYFVSGIPHVVVIDRQGMVRLFRIGSGEENARDVEDMITKCLAE